MRNAYFFSSFWESSYARTISYVEEEIILSTKDFPHVKVKDVVEIYHPDVVGSRILLQVHSLKDDIQTKGIVTLSYERVYVNF